MKYIANFSCLLFVPLFSMEERQRTKVIFSDGAEEQSKQTVAAKKRSDMIKVSDMPKSFQRELSKDIKEISREELLKELPKALFVFTEEEIEFLERCQANR